MSTSSQRDAAPVVRRIVLLPLAIVVAALFTVPVLWMLISSLRPEQEIFRYLSPLDIRTFLPTSLSLDSYSSVLSGAFGAGLLNSVITSLAAVAVGLPISASAAFGMSAIRFRGQGAILAFVVVSFLVPFDAIAIPLLHFFHDWGFQDTYWGIFLPAVGNGLAIFLLRQFFLGIPRELAEAVQVDGGGWWTIFTRVYLPLSRGPLVGSAIMLFMFQWNAYLWPLLIAPSTEHEIAPVALAGQLGQFQQFYGPLFAGTVILSLVPAVLLLGLQGTFTRSLALSGSKG